MHVSKGGGVAQGGGQVAEGAPPMGALAIFLGETKNSRVRGSFCTEGSRGGKRKFAAPTTKVAIQVGADTQLRDLETQYQIAYRSDSFAHIDLESLIVTFQFLMATTR